MKRILWVGVLAILLSSLIISCSTPKATNTFAGAWSTNVGTVNFIQNGSEISGSIEGYGGSRNDTFKGTLNENGEAVFTTDWFGDFTLALTDSTFKSTSSELAFCGIRSDNSQELPAGCGFSGKWLVPSKSVFLDGSYIILKQVGENVTGDIYDGSNKSYDSFTGKVNWGKGWHMIGTSAKRGDISFNINSAETGFEIVYGGSSNTEELCAVRDGQANAYLFYFTCTP